MAKRFKKEATTHFKKEGLIKEIIKLLEERKTPKQIAESFKLSEGQLTKFMAENKIPSSYEAYTRKRKTIEEEMNDIVNANKKPKTPWQKVKSKIIRIRRFR